ncbi:MAG: glycoside hydrolase family 92 protein, partial [Muribaculaceae bacterium]|nr:glycoside hydrolase family 92 protein [Muribaculaceae bacterium]
MKKKILKPFVSGIAMVAVISGCHGNSASCGSDEEIDLTSYVDPLVGSGDHGHVFVGANVPFGFVQLGPSQHVRGWDWCSGYHYSDSVIVGFSHTHLSGTGIGELGDVTFFPSCDVSKRESKFIHDNEEVRPGYYKVTLDDGVVAEMTATERTGMHRYTFPADTAFLLIDLNYGIGWDKPVETAIIAENDSVISGRRFSTGWAEDQKIYFVAKFSQPFDACALYGDSIAQIEFAGLEKPLLVKVGLSSTSIENARLNLEAENAAWNFDEVADNAKEKWNDALGTVKVTGTDEDDKKLFYTALYHTMFA